jgi:glycosyltransferase involved in cell wall biosynthesis
MRVLHVIPSVSLVHGGPSRALPLMEQVLCAAGVSVTTATTDDDGSSRRLRSDARPVESNGARRIYFRKWFDLYKIAPATLPWMWRHVRTFEIVHVHSLFSFTSVAMALVARCRGVPYIIRPLGTLMTYGVKQRRPWLKRVSLALIEGPLLRHAAAVHFTSQTEWDEAAALGIPLRGIVIPLGVEPPQPGDPKTIAREWPQLEGRVLLFLSRLDPKKNLEGLLRALAVVNQREPNANLIIAGEGSQAYVASLKKLSSRLGITKQVYWLGHVEGRRKDAAFAVADAFVLPSFSENFGISAVEAMLAGLPCVLGRGIALAKNIEAAGAALITEPEPEAIAWALRRLLDDDALRRDLGAKGEAFAERHYSTRVMAKQLIALYDDIRSGIGLR